VTIVAPAGFGSRVRARLAAYGAPTARIIGIDVARGLAVLGMYGAHIGVSEAFDWGQPSTWLDLVHGRSSILFALLAGVSIAIISGRMSPLDGTPLLQARVRIFTRAALIFALGGLLEYLGTNIAVILPVYAVLFVLSIPFLRWSSRALFIAAGVTGIVMPLLLFTDPYAYYPPTFTLGGGVIVDLLFSGTYPGLIWMAFIFAGMGIGRLDLSSLRVQLKLVVVGVALAAVFYTVGGLGGAALNGSDDEYVDSSSSSYDSKGSEIQDDVVPGEDVDLSGTECDVYEDGTFYCYPADYFEDYEEEPIEEPSWDVDWSALFDYSGIVTIQQHSGSPFEVFGSGGFAMAVLGLALLATRRRVIRWILYPVASVGAMALTAYSLHVLVIAVLGSDTAFALVDNWLYLYFILGALLVCTLWTTLVGRGPFEQLLTRVSHLAASITARTPTDRDAPEAPDRITPNDKGETHT
jgi:uncharacterized membrane protein YeiB